jgi:hypothetical protein
MNGRTKKREAPVTTQGSVLIFPRFHRGDPPDRQFCLALLGFKWHQYAWRRGRVALSDDAIDALDERAWQQRLRRWTARRPSPRR